MHNAKVYLYNTPLSEFIVIYLIASKLVVNTDETFSHIQLLSTLHDESGQLSLSITQYVDQTLTASHLPQTGYYHFLAQLVHYLDVFDILRSHIQMMKSLGKKYPEYYTKH